MKQTLFYQKEKYLHNAPLYSWNTAVLCLQDNVAKAEVCGLFKCVMNKENLEQLAFICHFLLVFNHYKSKYKVITPLWVSGKQLANRTWQYSSNSSHPWQVISIFVNCKGGGRSNHLYYIISCYIVLYYIILCYVMSYYIILCYIIFLISCCVMMYCITLGYVR